MMGNDGKSCFVGIDTSNYTTSAAACTVDRDGRVEVIANCKCPLPVEPGKRGLRQSDAVFAHTRNLPKVLSELREILEHAGYRAEAVGYSASPRDAEDSYMPCFLTGKAAAIAYASGAGIPAYPFSHQDGHIAAALYSSGALTEERFSKDPFLSFHVSGGTTEAVVVHPSEDGLTVQLVGGGADLHAGQVIDRVGVLMGLPFPCGPSLEALAVGNTAPLPPIRVCVQDGICHLSGLENQASALYRGRDNAPLVAAYVLTFIGKTLRRMTDQIEQSLVRENGENACPYPVVYAGGVMSNRFIRPILTERAGWDVYFAEPAFSADNAAGVAVLCARRAGASGKRRLP